MRARSTVRWTFGGARQQAGTLMLLAQCPVEDCPVGGCLRRFPPSTSNRSLRCGTNVRLTFVNPRLQPVNQPLPRSARRNRSDLPLCRLIQVGTSPKLTFVNRPKSLYTGRTSHRPQKMSRTASHSPWKTALAMWIRSCSHQPERPVLGHFPKGKSCPNRVNQPLPESARNNPSDFPLLGLFQLRIRPQLPKRELAQFPVHGYDISSSPSPPISDPRSQKPTSKTTNRQLLLQVAGDLDRGYTGAVYGGRGVSRPRPDSRLRRAFPPSRTVRWTKCHSKSWLCPTRSDFSDDTLSTSKAETVQSPWKEPRGVRVLAASVL